MRWAYRIASVVLLGIALAPLLPLALRVVLLVGAVALALVDLTAERLRPRPATRAVLAEIPPPPPGPPRYSDFEIKPPPLLVPQLGVSAFSWPQMRV